MDKTAYPKPIPIMPPTAFIRYHLSQVPEGLPIRELLRLAREDNTPLKRSSTARILARLRALGELVHHVDGRYAMKT